MGISRTCVQNTSASCWTFGSTRQRFIVCSATPSTSPLLSHQQIRLWLYRIEQLTWNSGIRFEMNESFTAEKPLQSSHGCVFTFEEDKLALAVLVHSIYLGRQAPPEHADQHGVARHHRVISHPPKPVVLGDNRRIIEKQRKHKYSLYGNRCVGKWSTASRSKSLSDSDQLHVCASC